MFKDGVSIVKDLESVLSLLRCANDALMTGDDCANDIIALNNVASGILEQIKKAAMK